MKTEQVIMKLQMQIRRLQLGLIGITVVGMLLLLSAFGLKEQKFDIIRAKGIIIEDAEGRDRILIGAPIPHSVGRVRTDTSAVREHWGKKFGNPDQYMKWYRDYRHSAICMVVMNEDGFDRVQIGDKLTDPNIGKRMFEFAGVLWNNSKGWEKGGAGVNTLKDGRARSVVGLDDDGGEAVHLVALEDGTKGLMISGVNGHLMLGMSNEDGTWFQNKLPFTGVKLFDKEGTLLWEQEMKAKE